jgi:rod shape-determining protein MreD
VKPVVAILILGLLTPMFQSVAASYVPVSLCPDFSLLLVVALGLCWRSAAGGMLIAALLGVLSDLLSGSLLGQHALLRVAVFCVSRLGNRGLDLRGAIPQALFVAVLTVVNAVALGVLTVFFASVTGIGFVEVRDLAPQALVNALFAPVVVAGVARIRSGLGDEETGRRLVTLAPRRFSS